MKLALITLQYGLLVGTLNGLLYGLEFLYGEDGTEYLLLADLHVVLHLAEYGRLHVVALVTKPDC